MDNKIPHFRTSRKALILWHGFGWKGPNDVKEFRLLHAMLKWTWGNIQKPNGNVIWQAFGPWDRKHRTEVSGVHPDNCLELGAASHDDLRIALDRTLAQPYYPFDITSRKTVLIAPTWHYGEVFAHWGRDADLFDRLLRRIHDRDANAIVRLHDSFRFDPEYLATLHDLISRYPNVCLKFKDRSPDNYLDLQVSDLLITNYSSIANLFYATASLHCTSIPSGAPTRSLSGVSSRWRVSGRSVWARPSTSGSSPRKSMEVSWRATSGSWRPSLRLLLMTLNAARRRP